MKAISMWQPHGSLLTTGAKPYETRGWATKFRGPILIHAAQRFVREEWEFYLSFQKFKMGLAPLVGKVMDFSCFTFVDVFGGVTVARPVDMPPACSIDSEEFIKAVPRGAFIGMADLIDCIPVEKMTRAQMLRSRGFGDFAPGRFAWEVANVKRFKTPILAKGRQGFFYGSVNLTGNELIPVP